MSSIWLEKSPDGWDTETLIENFLGKNKPQAIQLFHEKWVSEDFSYMHENGLIYYCEAALDYLQGPNSEKNEWNFPTGLLCSLYSQITISNIGKKALPIMKEIALYINNNHDKFDIDVNVNRVKKYISVIRNA